MQIHLPVHEATGNNELLDAVNTFLFHHQMIIDHIQHLQNALASNLPFYHTAEETVASQVVQSIHIELAAHQLMQKLLGVFVIENGNGHGEPAFEMLIQTMEIPMQRVNSTAFGILQATRTRISKTEYISCPSCGRTLFDLQETTAKIRSRTSHLKGVKIGIMGCIVNGPGEMADADYGYVGTGPGKITLYKEKDVVKKNVPEEQAVEELISLIKEHGDWVEVP